MTRPVGKIEVWEPGGGSALYTITDPVSVYYKDIVTTGIGNFTFRVYSHKDFSGTYTYPNIDVGDTVKIWLDWDTVAGNANFIGKVTKRSGPILTPTGWVREISGLSQGEILLRRFKENVLYNGTNASTIVQGWATDLSLGYVITANTNQPDIEVRTKTYFDLLRIISDYWIDASNKIQNDFYVAHNATKDLVWKPRPLRNTGVESFTTADFLADPQVIRSVKSVKNSIKVYGCAENTEPADIDDWTDSLTNWSASVGTVQLNSNATYIKFGSYSIQGVAAATHTFKRVIDRVTIRDINKLRFWRDTIGLTTSFKVRLHAPDSSNYFEHDLTTAGSWKLDELDLGPTNEYDADENPNATWTKTGSPNWWDIQAIEFTKSSNSPYSGTYIDGLWFFPERWSGTASDATSITNYGQRDLEVTDEKLHSDSECEQRAEALLLMKKDLPIQIKIAVLGNDNVLAGDRLTMTIPSESISSASYDVIAVENALTLDNWITQATMINSLNTRQPLTTNQVRALIDMNRNLRELGMDEKVIS